MYEPHIVMKECKKIFDHLNVLQMYLIYASEEVLYKNTFERSGEQICETPVWGGSAHGDQKG